MVETKEGKQYPYFLWAINVAYDFGSVGMGVQAHATRLLQTTSTPEAIPDWAKDAVRDYSSNYLCQPYVLVFLNPKSRDAEVLPCHPSLSASQHRKLLSRTDGEYEALFWETARATLAGGEEIPVDDPGKPMTRYEDLWPYVKAAEKRGLVSVRKPERFFGRREGFRNFQFFASDMSVILEDRFFDLHQQTLLFPQFRPKLIKAAVHKLGCMLAVTEQILYDASFSGQPIPASYKPEAQARQIKWQEMFGEEIPGIEGLYQKSLEVLTATANPKDSLIAYLFTLDVSQYFAR